MQGPETSFCKNDLMSVCTACTKDQQRNCWFYEKASSADRCMYFTFNEFCSSPEAQQQARKSEVA
jgi:hypothetical protein